MAESSVETLRAAAAKLRELAKEATPGPWGEWTVDPRPRRQVITSAGMPIAEVFERSERGPDAKWIALVHPGIAEPLAALLDEALPYARLPKWNQYPIVVHALAVARVLLGVPDGE